MKAVTGQLAEKIVTICREQTSSNVIALASIRIAEQLIFSEWVDSRDEPKHSESVEAPVRLPATP